MEEIKTVNLVFNSTEYIKCKKYFNKYGPYDRGTLKIHLDKLHELVSDITLDICGTIIIKIMRLVLQYEPISTLELFFDKIGVDYLAEILNDCNDSSLLEPAFENKDNKLIDYIAKFFLAKTDPPTICTFLQRAAESADDVHLDTVIFICDTILTAYIWRDTDPAEMYTASVCLTKNSIRSLAYMINKVNCFAKCGFNFIEVVMYAALYNRLDYADYLFQNVHHANQLSDEVTFNIMPELTNIESIIYLHQLHIDSRFEFTDQIAIGLLTHAMHRDQHHDKQIFAYVAEVFPLCVIALSGNILPELDQKSFYCKIISKCLYQICRM